MGLALSFVQASHGVAILCLLMVGSASWAGWRSEPPEVALVSQGEFTWFGLRVNRARLWTRRQPWVGTTPLPWS